MNKLALLSLALAAMALAQTPESEKKPEFEVASVRPAKDDNSHDVTRRAGFFRTHNVTLKRRIAIAYYIVSFRQASTDQRQYSSPRRSSECPGHHQRELFSPECATVRPSSLIHEDIRICSAQRVRPPPCVLAEERLL
jgi:hypothetical protein